MTKGEDQTHMYVKQEHAAGDSGGRGKNTLNQGLGPGPGPRLPEKVACIKMSTAVGRVYALIDSLPPPS